MTLTDLIAAIKTKVDGLELSADVPTIKKSFDFPVNWQTAQVKDYPIVVIVESSKESDYLNNRENFFTYVVEIYYLSLTQNAVLENAWKAMRRDVDQIMNAFDDDWNLGGTIANIVPVSVTFGLDRHDAASIELSSVIVLRCQYPRTNAT